MLKFHTIALSLLLAWAETAFAQKMKVNLEDGEYITYDISKVVSIQFLNNAFNTSYVNLHLPSGTRWATCNIGAENPWEVGDFFSWGETETKRTYSWATYTHCNGQYTTMKKYCTDSFYGTVDGLQQLEATDDAATQIGGEGWSMPTQEQFDELFDSNYTNWESSTLNGVEGVKVWSKTGSMSNSVFFPLVGGYIDGETTYNRDCGFYWMSDLYVGIDNLARSFSVGDHGNNISTHDSKNRRCGLNIRPVYKDIYGDDYEYVDLGLPSGTLWATCNVGAFNPADYGSHYSWGETETRSEYVWETYKWGEYGLTKYCNDSNKGYNGFTDDLTELEPEDDAATQHFGKHWQTPSREQWLELVDSEFTTITWTHLSNSEGLLNNGILIESKKNGASIFLPAAGTYNADGLSLVDSFGCYWSRTLLLEDCTAAFVIAFDSRGYIKGDNLTYRAMGRSIRPVRKK